MLSSQLDTLQKCGINAILFQVRAEGDALYKSSYEPWSRYLTGEQGVAPADGWDPLAWMVEQCHQREMECHAWINPYRAKTKGTKTMAYNHYAVKHPDRYFEYDNLDQLKIEEFESFILSNLDYLVKDKINSKEKIKTEF